MGKDADKLKAIKSRMQTDVAKAIHLTYTNCQNGIDEISSKILEMSLTTLREIEETIGKEIVLMPEVSVLASDIAPAYDVHINILWHLFCLNPVESLYEALWMNDVNSDKRNFHMDRLYSLRELCEDMGAELSFTTVPSKQHVDVVMGHKRFSKAE